MIYGNLSKPIPQPASFHSMRNEMIQAEQKAEALRFQLFLEAQASIEKITKRNPTPVSLTYYRLLILRLLSVTMVSAQLLVDGGMAQYLRSIQRNLQKLYDASYIGFKKYPVAKTGSFTQFYYLEPHAIPIIGRETTTFHKINEGTIEHDSLTALFLIQLFRHSAGQGISLVWHPPFAIADKICDGGVSLLKDGEIFLTLLLESDTGSHDHRELKEKTEIYLQFLEASQKRELVFLVAGEKRTLNLWETVESALKERGMEQFRERIFLLEDSKFPMPEFQKMMEKAKKA